jgi:ribosome biogenesis GTPase A
MPNFWKIVNNVIEKSNVILEIVDARLPDARNAELEEKVKRAGKNLLIVFNKCDLVKKETMDAKKKEVRNSIFVSSHKHLGTTMLKTKILELGSKDSIIVGVVGYPNTGKSSVINALAGRRKARTSPQSGHTRGVQFVNAGPRIKLIDTPGVIPWQEDDPFKHIMIAADTKVKDPEGFVYELMEALPGVIEEFYGVSDGNDVVETLEAIAKKKNKLKSGGVPDVETMSRIIIQDWQKGRILV